MAAHEFFWLETGGPFDPEADLGAVTWVDQSASTTVLPAEMTFRVGPKPDTAVFLVKADPARNSNFVFPPIAGVDLASQRRPDGSTGTLNLPAQDDGEVVPASTPLHPYELIRVLSSPDNTGSPSTVRFVGCVVACTLNLEAEEWEVTAFDIPRWYMSRIIHWGVLYQDAVITADPRYIEDALAVYNEDGCADQLYDAAHDPTIYHTEQDVNSYGGVRQPDKDTEMYAGYWTLGSILNQLRELYYIDPGTYYNPTVANILSWPECTDVQWPFLLEVSAVPETVKNLCLGGATLVECIDAIVRRAGNYDWGVIWDDANSVWKLSIFSLATGNPDLDYPTRPLTRGLLLNSTFNPPEIASGHITYDWSGCATEVGAFGNKTEWETTVGYGAITPSLASEEILIPSWTAPEQLGYFNALSSSSSTASQDFPSVFQKFLFKNDADWSTILGLATSGGHRIPLHQLLTEDAAVTDGTRRKISVRLWRYRNSSWELAPSNINVSSGKDGSIFIVGLDPGDVVHKPLDVTPRWLCDASGWVTYPFRLTIAVEDPNRLVGVENEVITNWPRMQHAVHDIKAIKETRVNALHRTATIPVINGGIVTEYVDRTPAVVLRDDTTVVDAIAARTLAALSHPQMEGTITLPVLDFDVMAGQIVTDLTGGSVSGPQLPTIRAYGHLHEVAFYGLAAEDSSQRRMVLKLRGI